MNAAECLERYRSHDSRNTTSTGFYAPPGQRELLLLLVVNAALTWSTIFLLHRSAKLVLQYGDNSAYCEVANAIIHWDFHNLQVQHFMGYPYFIAVVSLLLHVPTSVALWVIAVLSSFVSVWLAARMFDTLIAAYFAFTNFAWIQTSFLGGSEPLAMALTLGSLQTFRKRRFVVSALLASLAVTVRPLMIFVLVGIGIVLLYERKFGAFLSVFSIGLAIGIIYVAPLAFYYGDPLLTVHSYTTRDYGGGGIVGPHGHLFGWPFHGIVAGTFAYPAPWTNLLLSFLWIGFVLFGIRMMFSNRFRKYVKAHPNEAIFCGMYLSAIFCYDYLLWARSNFVRFAIPSLPFVFLATQRFLPKDRRLLWILCITSAVLAAVSAVGVKNVIGSGP